MARVRSQRRALVPVVDLFAGPGGLGEGFSAFAHERLGFDVVLSVEKDPAAHSTLFLRAFYRALCNADCDLSPYYEYIKGDITRDALFAACPGARDAAQSRCLHLELGPRNTPGIYDHLERALGDAKTWVLVGGPPCQAYSIVGRSRLSRLNRVEFEENEKHVLYREYLRILARYLPPVFVMENVKGLLSAQFSGDSTFARMISDLSSPTVAVREPVNGRKPAVRRGADYRLVSFLHSGDNLRPSQYVIESEKFGIPQRRHRVILLGIRADLDVPRGLTLKPRPAPSVRTVLADLPPVRSQLSHGDPSPGAWASAIRDGFAAFDGKGVDEDVMSVMMSALGRLRVNAGIGGRSVARVGNQPASDLARWLLDPALGVVPNHETRKHIPDDLVRYLFAASYAHVHGVSPMLHTFPPGLLPNHQNVPDAIDRRHGYFNDRFRVQVPDLPATTVTSHIAKDGHYFIHHDPAQCRSWTVREAARVQTFPDNYFFEGKRTDQYRQVGNAVPPYLALQIAGFVARVLGAT